MIDHNNIDNIDHIDHIDHIDQISEDNLLPGIDKYFETVINTVSISSFGLDELIAKVRCSTGLSFEASNIIIRLFFETLRNEMLKGNIITIANFGKFLIASPKNHSSIKRVFATFKPFKKLVLLLNDNS